MVSVQAVIIGKDPTRSCHVGSGIDAFYLPLNLVGIDPVGNGDHFSCG